MGARCVLFGMILRKLEGGDILREGGREGSEASGERESRGQGAGAGGGREDRGRRQWQADARLSCVSLCRSTTSSGLRA